MAMGKGIRYLIILAPLGKKIQLLIRCPSCLSYGTLGIHEFEPEMRLVALRMLCTDPGSFYRWTGTDEHERIGLLAVAVSRVSPHALR
jgi:hypothetical protein